MTRPQTRPPISGQLAFPAPAEPKRWGLIVDEVLLYAIASPGRDWWFEQGARLEARGAARILEICIAGAVVEHGPWSRDDAEFAQAHLIEHGIHPKALRLREWMAELPECSRAGRCKRCGRSHRARLPDD